MSSSPLGPHLRRIARRLGNSVSRGATKSVPQARQTERAELDARVHALLASPLFDVHWYSARSGCRADPARAANHYLTKGYKRQLSPHPLFDPVHYVAAFEPAAVPEVPFLDYLSRTADPAYPPSPLFDVAYYLEHHPSARRYNGGPLAHYADNWREGARPNDWFPASPDNTESLIDWVRVQWDEYEARTLALSSEPCSSPAEESGLSAVADPSSHEHRIVSIVVVTTADAESTAATIASVFAQEFRQWELIVVERCGEADRPVLACDDRRVERIVLPASSSAVALNAGLRAARGTHVALLCAGDTWDVTHLGLALGAIDGDSEAAQTAVRLTSRQARSARSATAAQPTAQAVTTARLDVGLNAHLSALVIPRAAALAAGGFDEGLPAAADQDFIHRLLHHVSFRFVSTPTVATAGRRPRTALAARRDQPALDQSTVPSWRDVVLNRHIVDWEALRTQTQEAGAVSVIMPTYRDWRLTTTAVERVVAAAVNSSRRVQILVVDNGCDGATSVVLDALSVRFDCVSVIHSAVNLGFALGNNLALSHANGEFVVFLNNDTEVMAGWLEPLLKAVKDSTVLGAQSLLLYPSGTIQSAGITFPICGGIPSAFLQGFPREDAEGVDVLRFSALTGAALAMRFADVIELRGFDPLFRNGMEDVDLGLRARRRWPDGYFRVCPDSVVVHHESRTPGRYEHSLLNRQLLLDRWGTTMPGDDAALWTGAGYEVLRHEVITSVSKDRRLDVPSAVVRRRASTESRDRAVRLRWAIKNPAPNDASGDHWGDTSFAEQLAKALRRHDQDVVIDRLPEFERATGIHDDVTLVLRGLSPYRPTWGQINLAWLISHPERLTRAEAESYDRLFAASLPWAAEQSARWGMRIDPLLQATDPDLFHPDRAKPGTGHPLLFVGGSRLVRRPIVAAAVEEGLPLSVYGPHWEDLIPSHFVKGESLPNSELGAAYRAADFVLNDHWEDMRTEGFVSNRLFDAAACAARVISDHMHGLENLFGRSVQVARSPGDLTRLTSSSNPDSVFGDDTERRSVARRIHAEHSFDTRAERLLAAALEIRASLSLASRAPARERIGDR